ncbi:hypothetical protein FRC06_002279 [Ceratobasidium sp. 370]|nr:hypothetical protein FRC06_002279 [Ceratobasidium sp. 370]
MFGLNNPISSALNMLASLSPEAPLDVSPDFDWRRGDLRSEPRRAPSSGLTGQISINDPLYDWSNGTSPAPSNRAPAPPSIYSNTSNHRVSTPSRYSCLSDPNGSGVQFCPIIQAPILHTPTARAPTSLDFQYPSSSASTPSSPPSLEAPLQVSAQHSGSKRKVPPARMNPPPKQRRRVAKEVIEVESDSEGSDYAGMKLYDTGYQSVDDKVRVKAKALPKAMVSRPTKGRGKSPPKSRAIIEDDEDNDEVGDDEDSESRGKVKVKEEPVGKPIKEEPIQEQKRHALI